MGSNADLILRIIAKDDASAALSKLGKNLAGALSIAAVADFGRRSVQAFAEAEAAQNQLSDAFARFPRLSDTSLSALRALNDELMRKTGVDNDAIASGQAVLAQFELTGQQIEDITPLLVDYALKTGKELPDAARAIGKATMGSTRALKELGISYKSTGDRAKDLANVTALLQDKVGGFAAQEATTAEGQLRRLDTTMGELQESVGAALAPALANAADGFTVIVAQMQPMLSDLTELTQMASDAATAVMALTNAAQALPGAMPAGFLDNFGIGLGAFVDGLLHVNDPIDRVKQQMAELGWVWDETAGTFVKAGNAAGSAGRSFGIAGVRADTLTVATDKLKAALDRLGGKNLNIAEATDQLQASFDAATKAAKENGRTLSAHTEAGRANRKALRDIATAADDAATAYAENGKSATFIKNRTQEARQAFIAAAKQMGLSGDAARDLADKYGLIPDRVKTTVETSGVDDALTRIANIKASWQAFLDMPDAYLNAHFGVTGPVSSGGGGGGGGNGHRSITGGKGAPRTGGPVPITYTPPAAPAWSGMNLQQVVSDHDFGKIEDRIAALRRRIRQTSDAEDKKALQERLKALQEELKSRERAMLSDLRSQRDELRDAAMEAAQDWLQSLADAVTEAQAAEQQALDALTQAQSTEQSALQSLTDVVNQRQQFKDAIAESFRQQGSVTGHGFADIAALTQGVTDAQKALFDARRDYNTALGTSEEAAALERLNQAKADAAAADKALAEGQSNNTPAGVLASMRKKVSQVQSLGNNLRKMRDMGYPTPIIQDILNQGLEGAQLAEVLASADPGVVAGFQQAQADMASAAAGLGQFGYELAGNPMDAAIGAAQDQYAAAQQAVAAAAAAYAASQGDTAAAQAAAAAAYAASGVPLRPLQISLTVDGHALVETLIDYRRSIGGAPLGLG